MSPRSRPGTTPTWRAGRRGFAATIGALLTLGVPAMAEAATAAAAVAEPGDTRTVSIGLGFETLRLPGGERLGLLGGQVLFGVGRGLWLGPVVYGAATGQRGGFFVGGLEVQQRWAIGPGLRLAAGLSLGGGGGAAAPVGNGLMLRPALTLLQDWGPLQAGLSLSQVHFPGTAMRSQQAGLQLAWRGPFNSAPLARLGERLGADGRSGLGFDSFALTTAQHRSPAAAPAQRFQLVGARLDQRLNDRGSSWGLEAAAAAQGSAAGYMEILVHAGQQWSPVDGLALGLRGAVGLGGGGGVLTGGGPLQRLDGTLALAWRPGWQLGGAWGRTHGGTPALNARRTELWLAADLEPADLPGRPGRAGTVRRNDWGGALLHIAPVQRSDGSRRALDAMGLVLDHWLGPQVYLSGQTYSAFSGGAGGYSVGLLGAGWASGAARPGWQVGAELLAGGAGGGGVAGATGAVLLGQAWAGHTLAGPAHRLRLGLGLMASSSGTPARPMLSLTWSRAFAQVGP